MSRPGSIVVLVLAAWMLVSLSRLIPADIDVPAVQAAPERTDAGDQRDVRDALDLALENERRAIAFYSAVMGEHGPRRPFATVIQAQRRDVDKLLGLYATLDLDTPPDQAIDPRFEVPADYRDACDLAEIVEIEKIAMYDQLLQRVADERVADERVADERVADERIADEHIADERIDDERVRDVFEFLRAASADRHLPAFRRHGHGWRSVDEAAFTAEQQTQLENAEMATGLMMGELRSALMAEIERGGHALAINVCREEAPRIAAAVGREKGVKIGRTSFKLRNAENVAPIWTRLLLRDFPEEPRYGVARDGRLGAVLPIHVSTNCLTCHGSSAEVPDDVRAAINLVYPNDAATGFADGDLRGWVWVETIAADAPDEGWGGRGTGRRPGQGQGSGAAGDPDTPAPPGTPDD